MPTTTPTRRTVFRGVGLGSIAAGLAARSALAAQMPSHAASALDANPDAELIALCAEFDRLETAWWDLHDGGAHPIEDDDERAIALAPLEAQQDPIAALIWATEARTMAGVRAKARSWLLFSPEILDGGGSWDGRFTASIVRDLVGTAVVDALTDEIELPAAINYRRGPPHVASWAEVSAAEFPWFGVRTNQREASKVIATNPTPLGVEALSSRRCAAQGGSVMLNKTWAFALALALAGAPVSSVLAAGAPNGENATAGTAAANASTPAAKMNPAGAKPSSPEAGDPAASKTGSARPDTTREPVNNK